MADHHLDHQASDKNIASPSSSKPYVLLGGLVGGLIGIGALLLVLIQSIEIIVEPGSAPSDSTTPAVPAESSVEVEQAEIEQNSLDSAPSQQNSRAGDSRIASPATTANPEMNADLESQIGSLRVSNQTPHPIRIALLPKRSDDISEASAAVASAYDEPVHWDFAPGEGASSGLVLALPDQPLKLRQGDILTAFAQDGSQRYWGPFVVGATPFPQWHEQDGEWRLVLSDEP